MSYATRHPEKEGTLKSVKDALRDYLAGNSKDPEKAKRGKALARSKRHGLTIYKGCKMRPAGEAA